MEQAGVSVNQSVFRSSGADTLRFSLALAHVLIGKPVSTLDCARACFSGTCASRSVGPDIRIVHHLGPFGDLALDPLAEMRGRIGNRLEAQVPQALPCLRQSDHARD